MCMLFVYLNPQAGPDSFCVIIANTRDEFYYRPSRVCHFWERNPHIVGGMDIEEGREGGTWLAMNTSGQIASVLNLVKPASIMEGTKESRGFLVVNYLESGSDCESYLRSLRREADLYNEFLLVTVDARPSMGELNACYYTNDGDDGPVHLRPGVHVFGNSAPTAPWRKVDIAKQMFETLTSTRSLKRKHREELISDIFSMLRDDTTHFPDQQLQRDMEGRPEEYMKQLSSIFVHPVFGFYGSRTHTVILIDGSGRVDYVERTMKEPIELPAATDRVKWITTRKQFTLNDQPSVRVASRL